MSASPTGLRFPSQMPMDERIMFGVVVDVKSRCWNWLGAVKTSKGYGRIVRNGRCFKAHRVSYETFVGPIPDGLVLDHLCRNRRCVNPEHLEAVTAVENTRRGVNLPWMINAAATHCYRNHPLSGENLNVTAKGFRVCRKCRSIYRRETYLRTGR